ncbi:hypothetical protein PLICRDRAFT_42932 [Plicaturopsis crispa FD-325 SS-3]|nr:hypothetical protein PLICRDRAFT_42932 [Plicaturopsis crispa FD-325 SS-3]
MPLYETLEAEFCPPLDTSLLAALVAEVERDSHGNAQSPTSGDVQGLRKMLQELAAQAERDEHEQLSTDFGCLDLAHSVTTEDTTTPELFDSGETTAASSSETSSSGSSAHHFSSPLGFLQAALPHIPSATLQRALLDAGVDADDNAESDVDMEAVIDGLLTREYIQELEERGIDALETEDVAEKSWETVEVKKKSTTFPKANANGVKAGKRKNISKGKTIPLVDIRQRQHVPLRVDTGSKSTPDPWTQLTSLSSHLADLLAPHPPAFFQSYFHSPAYSSPAHALRAALHSLMSPSDRDNADYNPTLFGLFDVLRASPKYESLSSAQSSSLLSDASLALHAAQGRADDALDIVRLLHDLDSDSDYALEMGIYHSPAPPPTPSTSPWLTAVPTSPTQSTIPPATRPPPTTKVKQTSTARSSAWQTIPARKHPPGPHPLAAAIPAYAQRPINTPSMLGRTGDNARRKRDELLREAGRAWARGNKKTHGGEVALYYAERAREQQEVVKSEALDEARATVQSKRLASGNKDTIDLHGTTVSEALVIVKEILSIDGASSTKPLKIITGRGTHSTNRVGVLKPAVKAALTEQGWNVGTWDGGLVVRGRNGGRR